MGEILNTLQRLQAVELKRLAIRRTLEAKAALIESRRKRVQKAEERIVEHHRGVRELQARIDFLSLDAASRAEAIAKHRDALNRAKTNKEYAAILATMNTEKADNAKLEAEVLRLMEQLQSLKDAGAELEEQKKKAVSELAAAEADAAAYQESCQADLDGLQTERDEVAALIAPTTLGVFNRVADRHDGQALAAIFKPFPKREEYACSGCNLKVSLEVINALRGRDEIQICKSCGRILYVEPSPIKSSK
jgi:predicted  nucleic acid-binding Zn-ribbon protein